MYAFETMQKLMLGNYSENTNMHKYTYICVRIYILILYKEYLTLYFVGANRIIACFCPFGMAEIVVNLRVKIKNKRIYKGSAENS